MTRQGVHPLSKVADEGSWKYTYIYICVDKSYIFFEGYGLGSSNACILEKDEKHDYPWHSHASQQVLLSLPSYDRFSMTLFYCFSMMDDALQHDHHGTAAHSISKNQTHQGNKQKQAQTSQSCHFFKAFGLHFGSTLR